MAHVVVVTTSYPEHAGDAQGHFVAAEVRRLGSEADVTVLAPGRLRSSLGGERVVSLGGRDAFGFPGVLEKLRQRPLNLLGVHDFVWRATRWLQSSPAPRRVIAHFLLPCGVPIATRALRGRDVPLEVVVHGSDARVFARSGPARQLIGRELLRSRARLRFVSSELERLVLGGLPAEQRRMLSQRARVEPSPLDVVGIPSKLEARRSLGIAERAKVAVIVARLVREKRVDVALEACRRVARLQTYVVGDGPERAQLQRRFPQVVFLGHLERPATLSHIAAADVLVSASLKEGAPSVVREARALGTPVVSLPAGDLRAWAEHDPGLWIVPA